MIFIAVLYAALRIASASTQTPDLISCSEDSNSNSLSIADITVSNAVIGGKMNLKYLLTLNEEVDEEPQLAVVMSSGETEFRCVNHSGSCAYKMCDGSIQIEQQVGAAWNNRCPIPAGTYPGDVDLTIPSWASHFIENNTVHLEIEGFSEIQILGCVEFDVVLEDAQ